MSKQSTATVLQHPGAKGHKPQTSPVSVKKGSPSPSTESRPSSKTTGTGASSLVPGKKEKFKDQFIPEADHIHGLKMAGTAGEIRELYLLKQKIDKLSKQAEKLKNSIKAAMLGCKATIAKTELGDLWIKSRLQEGKTADVIDGGLLLDEGVDVYIIEKCTKKGKPTISLYIEEA